MYIIRKSIYLAGFLAVSSNMYATPISIMTYNIRREGTEKSPERLWANRAASVIALLRNQNPDIIGFQEVTDNQKRQLGESLGENFNIVGQGRGSSWFGLGTDEATPIAYRKDKFSLIDSGTFSLNVGFVWMPWHASETGFLPRICTWVKLKDTQSNKEFYVYNTHLDHMYDAARLNGAREVMQNILKSNTAELPVIVTGDFNTEFEGAIKDSFSGFVSAKDLAKKVEGPSETSTGWGNDKLKTIDHILVRKGMSVESYCVIVSEQYPSDHRPVVAVIDL